MRPTESSETRKAHVDRDRIEKVRIDRSRPQVTEEQMAKICKIDPQRKGAETLPHPFLEALHDEACPMCQPPEDELLHSRIPPHWHHIPWDEVELKKHSLVDEKCHHVANVPIPDEVDLKMLGLVDSEGHHASKEMDEEAKQKAAEIGKKAHEQLEMVCKLNRNALACKLKQPHIKISHDVEVVDEDENHHADEPSDDEPSDSEAPSTMLTGRPSKDNGCDEDVKDAVLPDDESCLGYLDKTSSTGKKDSEEKTPAVAKLPPAHSPDAPSKPASRPSKSQVSGMPTKPNANGAVRTKPETAAGVKKILLGQPVQYFEFKFEPKTLDYSSTNGQRAPSTAASVAEEIQNGVANAPLSESEKSSADQNRPKISAVKPSKAVKSVQSASDTPSRSQVSNNMTAKPKADEAVRTNPNPDMAAGSTQPIVMTKTVETADGQFEFTIKFEVNLKPNPKKDAAPEAKR